VHGFIVGVANDVAVLAEPGVQVADGPGRREVASGEFNPHHSRGVSLDHEALFCRPRELLPQVATVRAAPSRQRAIAKMAHGPGGGKRR
jgi:hypothetical protein